MPLTSAWQSGEDPEKTNLFPPNPPRDGGLADAARHSGQEIDLPLPPRSAVPTQVLEVDVPTPDGWLPRSPRLIRLTGVHPFNVEPPLSDLYDQGFFTAPELFFVRNHGAVPRVMDDHVFNWKLQIDGLVENPFFITLRELITCYEQRTYPVTLVCAGNRRKEQNVVRKSKGFSWGAAGVSTALFTGVLLSEVLQRARPLHEARYVCMEGADELPNGHYGTSVKLNWAMDANRGMMLAYKMNGDMLHPDHGRPLRAVIPGQIGGRSVKWLKRLTLSARPSDNWYHIYDNRVLPTMISPTQAAKDPQWWMDERYAIFDLNTNSAIVYPAHDEILSLHTAGSVYRVKGYAYSGGGRRVTRVEVSLDQGHSWRLANIDYTEDKYRRARPQHVCGGLLDMSGRESCFCWCFWGIDVAVSDFRAAQDILVRAMDESMNIQPRDMYWSVLGMMNNPWFRVVVCKEKDLLRFEHPTQPALIPGGWMEKVKKAGGDLTNGHWGETLGARDMLQQSCADKLQEICMINESLRRIVTIDDLREHCTAQSPWFVVNGEVYDGTTYLNEHPGGAQSIISAAGMDSTEEFMAIHSETAKAMMKDYHLGSLDEHDKAILSRDSIQPCSNIEQSLTFLDPRKWKPAVLQAKRKVSWDTRIFSFRLEHAEQELGLPIGQHLLLRLKDPVTRETIIRSYTPISATGTQGTMDVLMKVYSNTKERRGGRMSQAMDVLPMGELVEFKGPIGKFEYLGRGKCRVKNQERLIDNFVMICGGTGVTPIFQVCREIMRDVNDPTKCIVLDGNRLVEDILCKAELDAMAEANGKKFKLIYTLTQAPKEWTGLRGRIAAPLLKEHAKLASHIKGEAMALICGPEAFEKSVRQALLGIGWNDEDLFFF